MKIKKHSIMVLDTETATLTDHVYDVGFVITDRKGREVHRYHALVEENVTVPEKMAKAYYQKKTYTHYMPMLDRQEIHIAKWADIVGEIREAVAVYDVNIVSAYNLGFDVKVMRATNKDLGDSPVFQKPVRMLDIWRFAAEALLSQKTYETFARNNGLVSPAGNLKSSAEASYKYMTRNPEFIESHTALADAEIENEILARCYAAKKRVPFEDVLDSKLPPWMIIPANAENMKTRRRV